MRKQRYDVIVLTEYLKDTCTHMRGERKRHSEIMAKHLASKGILKIIKKEKTKP